MYRKVEDHLLTENPVANVVLLNEVSKKLLIFTGFVGNLGWGKVKNYRTRGNAKRKAYCGIPECAAELDSFQKNRLRLFKIEV